MMKELEIEAKTERLDEVLAFVNGELDKTGCSEAVKTQVDIASEEIFVNIANYAYAPGSGKAKIGLSYSEQDKMFEIVFTDRGIPFDPLAKEDPDTDLSADERQIGGLGIYMVKMSMDKVLYRRENDQNILTIRKVLS